MPERKEDMRTLALVVLSLACPSAVQASRPMSQAAATTLEEAIRPAGPSVAESPIAFAAVHPDEASRGVKARTLPTADGNGERIVVYSESDAFRGASNPNRLDYQCLLKPAPLSMANFKS
jgi:hypothetical protein